MLRSTWCRGAVLAAVVALAVAIATSTTVSLAATGSDAAGDDSVSPTPSRIERQLQASGERSIRDEWPTPSVTADGWLVYDAGTNEPIAGMQATTPRPIASLAKLMTALVVVARVDPDELVTIPPQVNDLGADASRMDARAGERWKAGDLLRAMLAHSANDAAIALAVHVGEDEAGFVELMNERAERLGMNDSTFASATGLDAAGGTSTSTPVDMVVLAEHALAERAIATAVAERSIRLTRPGGSQLPPLPNRNPLLGTYDGVDGVKTGFTDAAGYMLVVHHVDDATGGELIVVTFASTSEKTRAGDATALLEWARPLRQRLLVVEGGTPLGSVPVQRSDEHVDLFACDDLFASVRVGQRIAQEVVVPRSVAAPVTEGDEIGELRIRAGTPPTADAEAVDDGADDDDRVLLDEAAVPICAGNDAAKLGGWDRFVDRARDWRSAWEAGVDEVEDTWSSLTGRAA